MARLRTGYDAEFDRKVMLAILKIVAECEQQGDSSPGYRQIIIGLNKTPLAKKMPGGIFSASTNIQRSYVGSLLEHLRDDELLERNEVQEKAYFSYKKFVYSLTPRGHDIVEHPERLQASPSSRQTPRKRHAPPEVGNVEERGETQQPGAEDGIARQDSARIKCERFADDAEKILRYLTADRPHQERTASFMAHETWKTGERLSLSACNPVSIGTLLKTLEREGYALLDPSPLKGNSKPYRITAEGHALLASPERAAALAQVFEKGMSKQNKPHPHVIAARNEMRRHAAILEALQDAQAHFGEARAKRTVSPEEVAAKSRSGLIRTLRESGFTSFSSDTLVNDMQALERMGCIQSVIHQPDANRGAVHYLQEVTQEGLYYLQKIESELHRRGIEIGMEGRGA